MTTTATTKSWIDRYPRVAPLLVFILIAAITVFSIIAIERGEAAREQVRLSQTADTLTAALSRRAATTAAYLRAGSALFETTGTVTPETFRRFAEESQLDQNFRGTEGIGWAPALRPQEIAAFEEQVSRYLDRPVTLYPEPSPGTRMVVPVYYLQPTTNRNRQVIGFDMFSDPTRRAAIEEAARKGQPVASAPVTLAERGPDPQPGFLIYMPVFGGAGGDQLRGVIYSPFRSEELLRGAFAAEATGGDQFHVELVDIGLAEPRTIASAGPERFANRAASAVLTIASRPYRLDVFAAQQPMLSTLSMITLLFGLIVAILLLLLVRLLSRRMREDRQRLAWFEEQNSIRNSLTRELNHRVKNTLANVLSIVALTRRRATDLDEFADSLDGRIRALSATHDLLTRSEWGTTPIAEVVAAEVAPYARGRDSAVESDGPEVELAPNDALSLGMAIHELATNAAKYGALSQAGGVVRISWELAEPNLARLNWVESGGPAVPEIRTRGFGTDLLQKIIAHELRHPVELEFAPEGVRCTLVVPVRQPSPFAMRAAPAAPARETEFTPAA